MGLEKKYISVCNKYIKKFCKKQDVDFEGWVGDIVGGIAYCGDFFFNFHDIALDVNTEQKKGLIFDWYNATIETPEKAINYYSYTKGLRMT